MDEDKVDWNRIEQIRLLNTLEEKSYILARVENRYLNSSSGVKIGGRNISKKNDELKPEYEKCLSDVLLTLYQVNNKINSYPPKEQTFIKGIVEIYKKYDTIGLFENGQDTKRTDK